jgi:hypothetical protein
MDLNLSINIEGLDKSVEAVAYLTSDHGETYPGMPSPLNEIYARLKAIAGQTTEFATEKLS